LSGQVAHPLVERNRFAGKNKKRHIAATIDMPFYMVRKNLLEQYRIMNATGENEQ